MLADPTDIRFRLRNVRAGAVLAVAIAALDAVYAALTWGDPHRGVLAGGAAVLAVLAVAVLRLPLDRLVRHPRADVTLLSGGGLLVALAGAGPLLAIAGATGGAPVLHTAFVAVSFAAAGGLCAWQAHNHRVRRAELDRVSRADPLTGCLNRRGFEERFEAELATAGRSGYPLALVLIDLDDFKEVNDTRGHAAGDDVLRWVVARIEPILRPSDALGRIGGDEFAIVIPAAGRAEAELVAERVQEALSERAPASLGVASCPEDGTDAEELHEAADVELYAAKHGRPTARSAARPRELSWAATLAQAVDLRMAAHHDHAATVGELAVDLARRLGWSDDDELGRLRVAALLHDVGKVAVPDSMLRKAGPLDASELEVIRRHPIVGAEIVGRIDGMEEVAEWIRCSHEHLDGSGYPSGLAGDQIPLAARILLVADAFDAMTSDRPYRHALPIALAVEELRRCSGAQFDPECVDALVAVVAARSDL